jgi:hypothetical protein
LTAGKKWARIPHKNHLTKILSYSSKLYLLFNTQNFSKITSPTVGCQKIKSIYMSSQFSLLCVYVMAGI